MRVDLSTESGPGALIASAVTTYEHIDILVNNVGGVQPRPDGYLSITDEDWASTFTINFFAAVRTMARIIENTEDHGLHRIRPLGTRPNSKGGAVTAAAAEIGELLGCKYLITFTTSGDSTRRLSRVRPRIPMLAFTPNQWTRSQLALTWGVETFLVPDARHTDEMAMQVDEVLMAAGRVVEGDNVIIVAGSPPGIPGSTNALRVHRIGDAKNRVAPAYSDIATGAV
jgi:pyruvate kinase